MTTSKPSPSTAPSAQAALGQEEVVEIRLSPSEMRAFLAAQYGPVFRMVLTQLEAAACSCWTLHQLRDGRYAMWRREADMPPVQIGNLSLIRAINKARLDDDEE